jgi:hypothetical protein
MNEMNITICFIVSVLLLLPHHLVAAVTRARQITIEQSRKAVAEKALCRLERSADEFESILAQALDSSVLDHTDLEDRLKEWSSLFSDEVRTARQYFELASHKRPDRWAAEHFREHFGNVMMAATAVNRAMVRRGFAPKAEMVWGGIRADLNRVANFVGTPPLPDMTVLLLQPAPVSILSRSAVKQVMRDLKGEADRFKDKLKKNWSFRRDAAQWRVSQHWANELESATDNLLEKYKRNDVPEFQFKLEEILMLAAGLNRALLLTPTRGVPIAEWTLMRHDLNALAGQFGYTIVPRTLGT